MKNYISSSKPYEILMGTNTADDISCVYTHDHLQVYAGGGSDTVRCNTSYTQIYGEDGDDVLMIGAGIYGGTAQTVDGGNGSDEIQVSGANPDVTIRLGTGNDTVSVCSYPKSFPSSTHHGKFIFEDFTSNDVLQINYICYVKKDFGEDNYYEKITAPRTFSLSVENNNYVLTDSRNEMTLVFTNIENGNDLLNVKVHDVYYCSETYRYETTLGEMLKKGSATPSTQITYNGGDLNISDYKSGDVIIWNTVFSGIGLAGNDLHFYSGASALRIQECRDKLIQINDTSGNAAGYAYMSSSSGTLDGRSISGAVEVIIGGDNSSNLIVGGDTSSSLWGGGGFASDTLQGGSGADVFFYGSGDGDDYILESNSLDQVIFYSNIQFQSIYINNCSDLNIQTSSGNLVVTNWSENGMNNFQLSDGSRYRLKNNNASIEVQKIT